jgi:hypothetical protein
MNVPDRAKAVSPEAQLLVLHGYDMRNFAVHAGVAGTMNSKCAHQVRPPPTVIQLRRRPLNGSRQDCFGGQRINLRGFLGNFKIGRM